MTLQFLTLALIGGVLCLDRIYAQTLVSRPVVTGTIVGLVLGNFQAGLLMGAILELLWIDQSPIGTMVPPNDTLSTVVITSCTLLASGNPGVVSRELMALAILLLVPSAILAQKMDAFIFKRNDHLARIALSYAIRGNLRGVERQHLLALLKAFILSTLLSLALLYAGYHVLIRVYPQVPEKIMNALVYVYYFIPILGVGVALNTINLRKMIPAFCSIFIVITILLDLIF